MKTETDEIVDCLLVGGIVLIPTDTVYGLAVRPDFAKSVDKLYAIKHRPRNFNLPIMVASVDELRLLGLEINDRAGRLLQSQYVPGPLTLAMGFVDGPKVPWLSGREEVAVRIPDDVRILSVLRRTGPLLVTSANLHGRPTPETVNQILAELDGVPDMVIDSGPLQTIPSTLVNCRRNPPEIEREGSVSKEDLLAFIGTER